LYCRKLKGPDQPAEGPHSFLGGPTRKLDNLAFRTALTKYGDCLRENGIKLPAANTSEKGSVFDTKGINTSSKQFKAAAAKCRGALAGAIRRPAGAAGGPPVGG
jgi:hypothetical protein